jgi:hypothetical protein
LTTAAQNGEDEAQLASDDVDLDNPLIIVSADTHISPRLKDMRHYRPSKYLADYDTFMNQPSAMDYGNLVNETPGG